MEKKNGKQSARVGGQLGKGLLAVLLAVGLLCSAKPVQAYVIEGDAGDGSYSWVIWTRSMPKTTGEALPDSAWDYTGWKQKDGNWFFYKNGFKYQGWLHGAKGWYYFDRTGKMVTGWRQENGEWYYLDANGLMHTGWLHDKNGQWYYLNKSGVLQTGTQKVDGKWEAFDQNGAWQRPQATSALVPMGSLQHEADFRKYMSEAEYRQAYQAARAIVEPMRGLRRTAQLEAIAKSLRQMVDSGLVQYSTSKKHYSDPYGYLVLHVASCAGCVRTTGLCLNILGIPYEHVNANQWTHQWARVKVGNAYWICDAYGLYVGPEPAPYRHPNV